MLRFALLLLLLCSACATIPPPHRSIVSCYSGEWTFNGDITLWLFSDNSYLWERSLGSCGVQGNADIGWSVFEWGTWSRTAQTVTLRAKPFGKFAPDDTFLSGHRTFQSQFAHGKRILILDIDGNSIRLGETTPPPAPPAITPAPNGPRH